MFESAVTLDPAKPQSNRSGSAPSGSGGAGAQDFAALFTRHAYAAFANAQTVRETQLPDFARPISADARGTLEQSPDTDYPQRPVRSPEESPPASDPAEAARAPHRTDAERPGHDNHDDAALPALSETAAYRSGAAPSPQSAERAAPATTTNATPPPSGTDTASQQNRQAGDAAAQALKAQVVDGNAKEQLPQLRHTLSSGAALVAQSGGGKSVGAGENTALANAGGNTASSIAAGAAQASAQAGQKAKGQTGAANAVAGNAAQSAGAAPAAAAAVPTAAAGSGQFWQQGSNNRSLMNGGAAGTPMQASALARADGLAAAGDGAAGFQVPIRPAGQAAPPKPLPPVPPRLISNQVAVQIQKGLSQGGDRISIQLKPAELGRVDVRLDMVGDGRVAAVISADRADTLDLLQRDARLLQNALQDAGLETDGNSLSFELKGQSGGQSDQALGQSAGSPDDEEESAGLPHHINSEPSIVSDDRVDVHI